MPEQFEKLTPQEELAKLKPIPPETKKTPKEQPEEQLTPEEEKEIEEISKEIDVLQSKDEMEISLAELRRLLELFRKREKIKSKKELKEWTLEGELTEKDVLAEFKAGGDVLAANFSPDGEKVVIGSSDRMMRVFGRE